ncbi:MAG: class I SAM-dependent methyltransferase [Candidatus Omnitrophica bacterium]|nr:class I SAM-dependent methyltransferase [Candidatus Omnitrophota bacterium]
MHDSSFQEMKFFVERYLDRSRELSVLDIGSKDVNGSYRRLFDSPNWKYTGLDLEPGKNVDIVANGPYSYPVADRSFDVVISGSTLEHVLDMHAFIREAARVLTKDGLMCIIAPWTWGQHKHPVDCWRILPDGMRFLLGEIGRLPVLNVHKNGSDCVGIAGKLQKDLKIVFGAMINDHLRWNMCLKQSEINYDLHFLANPKQATKALNQLLELCEKDGADVAVLTHQDMSYRRGWLDQVKAQLFCLPDSWVVAGIIGKDLKGNICGKLHDMRIAPVFDTSNLHDFPHEASCFDECCIIVNLKKGFRFDEGLTGFDLYGTECVLQAWERGETAWVLDAWAEHYCLRPFTWMPDDSFKRNYKWLWERFPNAKRIDTTAIGIVQDREEMEDAVS